MSQLPTPELNMIVDKVSSPGQQQMEDKEAHFTGVEIEEVQWDDSLFEQTEPHNNDTHSVISLDSDSSDSTSADTPQIVSFTKELPKVDPSEPVSKSSAKRKRSVTPPRTDQANDSSVSLSAKGRKSGKLSKPFKPVATANECELCDYLGDRRSRNDIYLHYFQAHGQYRLHCPIRGCFGSFQTPSLLGTHARLGHRKPKDLTCVLCNSKPANASTAVDLNAHYSEVHGKDSVKSFASFFAEINFDASAFFPSSGE